MMTSNCLTQITAQKNYRLQPCRCVFIYMYIYANSYSTSPSSLTSANKGSSHPLYNLFSLLFSSLLSPSPLFPPMGMKARSASARQKLQAANTGFIFFKKLFLIFASTSLIILIQFTRINFHLKKKEMKFNNQCL